MRYLTAAEYELRAGAAVPCDATGAVATARIEAALDDASGICMGELPDDLLDDDGAPLALTALPERLQGALPGIVFALAQCELADGTLGSEEVMIERKRTAMAQLRRLGNAPNRRAVQAEIVAGNSGWIPGPDDDDLADPEDDPEDGG